MTAERWNIKGVEHRRANQQEIEILQGLPGAPHVTYACECGHGHWTAKNLTLTSYGRFVSMRNIFYFGEGPECPCPASSLVCVVPVKE